MSHSNVAPPSLASLTKPKLTVIEHGPERRAGDVEIVPHGRDSWQVRQWVLDPATGKVEPRVITRDDAPDDRSSQHHFHAWGEFDAAERYAKRYVQGETDGQRFRAEIAKHAATGPIFIGNYKGE